MIEQNNTPQPSNPSLTDLMVLFKKQMMNDLFCHHIGTIRKFDSSTQTATIEIGYKKTKFVTNSEGQVKPQFIDYPPLEDCPIIFLGGGKSHLTFPIIAGDECLVIFNDVSIDNWYEGNSGAPVNSSRLHSSADAIAIVGMRSRISKINNFDTARAGITNDKAKVLVGASKILIENDSLNLARIINSLVDKVTALAEDVANLSTSISTMTMSGIPNAPATTSGVPNNAADFISIKTAIGDSTTGLISELANIKTSFSGLLDENKST